MNTEEYDKAGRLSVEDQQMMGSPFIMLTPKEVRSMSWQDTILSERHESCPQWLFDASYPFFPPSSGDTVGDYTNDS